ncbi:MAG TPA: TIGR00730 family Rossman fold protein [Gemmatimonadaceae bacterium]|jgi:hypothetical protein
MDNRKLSICVFCGSSHGLLPQFAETAKRLGALIGSNGYSLVFGGGNVGLMGEIARAAHAAGAPILGVLPEFLRHVERPLNGTEELIVVPDMQQRKAIMLDRADAFIALPGGLGTFDEIFEVLSTAQLQVHKKPIVLIDSEGYFAPLQALLAAVVRQGFAIRSIENFYRVVATPEAALQCISSWPGAASSTTQGDPRG